MTPREKIEQARIPFVISELRRICPRRVEGQSDDFAFKMDGYSLIDLNSLVNEAATAIDTLLAELEAARGRVERLEGNLRSIERHCDARGLHGVRGMTRTALAEPTP